MSNTNTEKVYVLLKDLPDLKAGAEFTHIKGTNIYDYGSGDKRKKIIQYGVTEVENNPEWFTLKQPVEDKRIEVTTLKEASFVQGYARRYYFDTEQVVPPEKYEAVKQAIEKTINGENDNPAPPTLERQESKEDKGWEILSYSMKNRIEKNSIFTKYRDGVFVSSFMLGTEFIEDKICKVSDIHSVRRKSIKNEF